MIENVPSNLDAKNSDALLEMREQPSSRLPAALHDAATRIAQAPAG